MSLEPDAEQIQPAETVGPYKLLVELQAQIMSVKQQNERIERVCSTLRDELHARRAGDSGATDHGQ